MIRKIILGSVLLVLPMLLTFVDRSAGQLQAEEESKKQETRKVPAMRERTYKTIAEAQVFIENNQAAQGVPILKELLNSRGLNRYEVAQIWNMLAFAYYTLEDMDNTLLAYLEVLKQEEISIALELGTLRSLFQLYYQKGDYRTAISYIDRWMALNETPDANFMYLKATSYYQLEEYGTALGFALEVLDIAQSQQKVVRENWLYMVVILYNELKDYDNVIVYLERLIVDFPKKQYWMHLAGMYSEKNLDDKALSAYYAAYTQNMLLKETELVMLSQRLMNAEVPAEAGTILADGLKRGIITKNERNLRLVAQAWTMAQETEKAIAAWEAATEHAENGEIFYRLAQALANDDKHKKAVAAYQSAIDKGDLDNPRDVDFWMGISLMQMESWDDAVQAFRAAAKDPKKEKQCRQYIRYIEGERHRQEELRKMLAG